MKHVNLVATAQMLSKILPEKISADARGVASADFPIDPAKCLTGFGRWLAEQISTTRFDDDLSRLVIVTWDTEQDLHIREFAQKMQLGHIRSSTDAERLFDLMEKWIAKQRKVISVYGAAQFTLRSYDFEWPVYGSLNADGLRRNLGQGRRLPGVKSPEQFFDKCGSMIRSTHPQRVYVAHNRAEVPPQLGVCHP